MLCAFRAGRWTCILFSLVILQEAWGRPGQCLSGLSAIPLTEEQLRLVSDSKISDRYPAKFLRETRRALEGEALVVIKESDVEPKNEDGATTTPLGDVQHALMDKLLLNSRLDQATDESGVRSVWYDEFRKWMEHKHKDLFSIEVLVALHEKGETVGSFYQSLKKDFDEEYRNRNRFGLHRVIDESENRFARKIAQLKISGSALLQKYKKWLVIGAGGLVIYAFGGDLIKRQAGNELKFQVVETRTDMAMAIQSGLSKMRFEDRKSMYEQFQKSREHISQETARVISQIPGMTAEKANESIHKLEQMYVNYQWFSDRFIPQSINDGRNVFANTQIQHPGNWIANVNTAYGNFLTVREAIYENNTEIKKLDIQLSEKPNPEIRSQILSLKTELQKKVKELEAELLVHRKQTATMLASWKIHQLVFAEFFAPDSKFPERGALARNIERDLGAEFYLRTFKDEFEATSRELSFAFDSGQVSAALQSRLSPPAPPESNDP